MSDLQSSDLEELLRVIATSTFPEETGSTRLRQIAFLNLINMQHRIGARPTARSLSKILNAPAAQMDLLAQTLEERGVLRRIVTPALTKGKPGKVLHIRADAIKELNDRHVEATGRALIAGDEL